MFVDLPRGLPSQRNEMKMFTYVVRNVDVKIFILSFTDSKTSLKWVKATIVIKTVSNHDDGNW